MAKIKFSWTTEIIGGLAVFLAMSYVLLANPRILGDIPDRVIGTSTYAGPDPGVIFVSTCLLAGVLSIAIGWRAWSPSAIACGMGLNSLMATFATELEFNWRWLLVINFVVAAVVLAMSRAARGQRSLRDRLLRDPSFLPASLSSIVEASVAGMLAGIAFDMIRQDDCRILLQRECRNTDFGTLTLPQFANAEGLLPLGVAVLSLLALFAVNLISTLAADKCEAIAANSSSTLNRGLARLGARISRLTNSVKIVAVAICITIVFERLYAWSGLAGEQIDGLRFAAPSLTGPLNFAKPLEDSLALAIVYGGTIAFVLLFDVSGSPHQMLPEQPPPSVKKYGAQAGEAWAPNREERVRRGFVWEALGNLIAPFFSVSPTTCYGENNVVRDVGEAPNDGARTGIPAIIAGLLFLGVLAYAFASPSQVQYWLAIVPGAAIAVMLAWISLIIGMALLQNTRLAPNQSEHGEDPLVARSELIAAGLASLAASLWQGLALGLCVGIIMVFTVRLIASLFGRSATIQPALYAMTLLSIIALVGQVAMS